SVPNAFTVGARTLNITANDDSKTYGATKSYGAGSTAFLSSGLQNSETIGSVTITASGGTAATDPVGSYDLTPSAATGGSFTASNYDIHYFKGTLTVGKAPLTYTASGSKTYGSTTDNSLAGGFSGFQNLDNQFTAAGFVAPSCSSATGAVATANVGSYTIN